MFFHKTSHRVEPTGLLRIMKDWDGSQTPQPTQGQNKLSTSSPNTIIYSLFCQKSKTIFVHRLRNAAEVVQGMANRSRLSLTEPQFTSNINFWATTWHERWSHFTQGKRSVLKEASSCVSTDARCLNFYCLNHLVVEFVIFPFQSIINCSINRLSWNTEQFLSKMSHGYTFLSTYLCSKSTINRQVFYKTPLWWCLSGLRSISAV